MLAVAALAECPTTRVFHVCLDDGRTDALDDRFHRIGRCIRRVTVPREIEGDRPPPGIDGLQLGQRRPPHPPVEREPVKQDERRAVVSSADVVGGQAGVRAGGERVGLLHLRSLAYWDSVNYRSVRRPIDWRKPWVRERSDDVPFR